MAEESTPTTETTAPAGVTIEKADRSQLEAMLNGDTLVAVEPTDKTDESAKDFADKIPLDEDGKPKAEEKPAAEETPAKTDEKPVDDADEKDDGKKPKKWRLPLDPGDAKREAFYTLLKAGKTPQEATAAVYGDEAAPAKPAAEESKPAPKPEEVRVSLKAAEAALERALDDGDADAYENASEKVAQLRTALPDADIMASISAARKAAKDAEKNVDFTAQANAEREVQKWQQALDAKRANAREVQAREVQKRQTTEAENQRAAVAKAQDLYSFAKEGDSLFPKFEKFLTEAQGNPEYAGILPDRQNGVRGVPNWPVIMADAFAAQEGITRSAKKSAPASAAPAATKTMPKAPATKATLLTSSESSSSAEAPSREEAAKQVLEKGLKAKSSKELDAIMVGMSFDNPGSGAGGF